MLAMGGSRPSRDCVRAIWISARASDTPSRHNDAKQHCVTIEFFAGVWGRFLARKSPRMIVRAAAALAEQVPSPLQSTPALGTPALWRGPLSLDKEAQTVLYSPSLAVWRPSATVAAAPRASSRGPEERCRTHESPDNVLSFLVEFGPDHVVVDSTELDRVH
jgi:hypothetical protein